MSLRFVLNDKNSSAVPEKHLDFFRFCERFTNHDSVLTRRKTSSAPRSSHESSKHKSCSDSKRSRQPARSMHAARRSPFEIHQKLQLSCESGYRSQSELGWWQNFLSRQRKVTLNKRHQVEPAVSVALRYPSVART